MKPLLIAVLFLLTGTLAYSQDKVIISTHDNGQPKLVVYVKGKGATRVRVKEEYYYENGQVEFYCDLKDDKEHGKCEYFYEDGTLQMMEIWKKGVETGTHKEYYPDGTIAKTTVYKNGMKVSETPH